MRLVSIALVLPVLMLSSAAFAQQAGVQLPASPVIIPPAPVVPSPVPSSVTGLGLNLMGMNSGLSTGFTPGIGASAAPNLNVGPTLGLNPGLDPSLRAAVLPSISGGMSPGMNSGMGRMRGMR